MKELLRKEIKSHLNVFYIFLTIFAIIQIYLLSRVGKWTSGVPLSSSVMISLNFLFFYAFFRGYNSLRNEWQNRTIIFLFSLPVKRIKLLFSKLIALDFEILVFYLLASLFAYGIFRLDFPYWGGVFSWKLFIIVISLFVVILLVPVFGFFVFTLSRSVGKKEGLVSFLGVILLFILFYYFSKLFHLIAGESLNIQLVYTLKTTGENFTTSFSLKPFVEFIVFTPIIFGITAFLFSRKVEL